MNGFQNKRKEFVFTYKKFLEKLIKLYQNSKLDKKDFFMFLKKYKNIIHCYKKNME